MSKRQDKKHPSCDIRDMAMASLARMGTLIFLVFYVCICRWHDALQTYATRHDCMAVMPSKPTQLGHKKRSSFHCKVNINVHFGMTHGAYMWVFSPSGVVSSVIVLANDSSCFKPQPPTRTAVDALCLYFRGAAKQPQNSNTDYRYT